MKLRQAIENEVPPGFKLVGYTLDVTIQGEYDHYQGTTKCEKLNSDGSSVVRSHEFLAVVETHSGNVIDAMPLGKPRLRFHIAPSKIEAEKIGFDEAALMRDFEQLVYSDLDQLVTFFTGWFDEGIEQDDAQRIVDGFTEHEYFAGVNCGEAFDGSDRDNYGRYLIGQALSFLSNGNRRDWWGVHPVLKPHFEEWLSTFGTSVTT